MKRITEPGHRVLEHPADMGLEIVAPDLRGLFAESALALTGVLLDLESIDSSKLEEVVEVSGRDREDLLFQWMSEILFLFDCEGKILSRVEFEQFVCEAEGDSKLVARVFGEEFQSDSGHHQVKTYVKAITLHQLRIADTEDGFSATVYLDI